MQNHVAITPANLSALKNEVLWLLDHPGMADLVDLAIEKQEEILRANFERQQDAANTVDDRTHAALWCLQRRWDLTHGVTAELKFWPVPLVARRQKVSGETSYAFQREYREFQ